MAKNRTLPLIVGGVVVLGALVAIGLTRDASLPFFGGGGSGDREFLAGLEGAHDRVAAIEIIEDEVEIRLERDGEIWRMATKDGYPVETARVEALLSDLDRLEGLKMVTSTPNDFATYGVMEDDGGTRLRLLDSEGSLIAGLVAGTVVSDPAASDLIASHVRLEQAEEVWLIDGELRIEGEPLAWIGEDLLAIDRSRIYEVRTATADPEQSLLVQRAEPTSQTFVAPNLPEDVDLEGPWILGDIVAPLERIVLEDVRAAQDLGVEPLRAEVRTLDGLQLSIDLYEEEAAVWAEVEAMPIEPLITVNEMEDNGLDVGPTDLGSYLTASQVEEEIERLRARTDGWQFRLPAHVASRLTMTIDEAGEQETRF